MAPAANNVVKAASLGATTPNGRVEPPSTDGRPEAASTVGRPEAFAPRQRHPIQLSHFEGPLDLLLFLIRRNEIDIYDIPIEEVTRQYLEILHGAERLDLEVAGDFFVMAATLMYLKSRLLLPASEEPAEPEVEEDDALIDPRWELVQQLLEYKKYKEIALAFRQRIVGQQDLLPRHYAEPPPSAESRPLKPSDRLEIWNSFNQILRRLQSRLEDGQINDEVITTADRMAAILEVARQRSTFTFDDLLPAVGALSINFLVSTFLALLELARLKHLWLSQSANFATILCHVRDPQAPDEDDAVATTEAPTTVALAVETHALSATEAP